jgi:hypothetical protein
MNWLRIIVGLSLLIGGGVAGYNLRTPETVTKVETKTNTVTEQVDRVITKVVTVKETAPDKTVKETVTTETTQDKTVKQVEKVKDNQAVKQATLATKDRKSYSLGLKWQPD